MHATCFREFSDSFRYRRRRLPLWMDTARPRRNEDVMEKRQMLDVPHVDTQDVVTDEESTLRRQVAALREDNEDLRASALWWKALYEEAQRRCADLESSSKARANARLDPRFTMTSPSSAHAPRPGATTRPL
jgi:hypothetical protein